MIKTLPVGMGKGAEMQFVMMLIVIVLTPLAHLYNDIPIIHVTCCITSR
jgi:hypothetical protein